MTTEIIAALEQDRLERQERSEHDRRKARHRYDPPGLNPKVERAFQKLCEALSMAEGTSEALGECRAHRDPDRLHWRRTSIRQASQKLWAAA
jgi:hypothetical protein